MELKWGQECLLHKVRLTGPTPYLNLVLVFIPGVRADKPAHLNHRAAPPFKGMPTIYHQDLAFPILPHFPSPLPSSRH